MNELKPKRYSLSRRALYKGPVAVYKRGGKKELKERKREKNRAFFYGRHAPKWVNPLSPSIALPSIRGKRFILGHTPFRAGLSKQLISALKLLVLREQFFLSLVRAPW